MISWMARPVALTGDVDAAQHTITVTDPIAISTNPDSIAVGTTLTIDRFSLCKVPGIAQLEDVTVLGSLGTEQDLSVIAVVDEDQHLAPTTWQQSYDDVRALLDLVDRRSTLQALVERSVDDPTSAMPSEPDPYDAWHALPADQRQLDPAATPPRVLDEFAVTAVTIGFDMPPELRHTAGQDASAESFVRLSAPELAVITTVATSISNTFIGPSLIPADGPWSWTSSRPTARCWRGPSTSASYATSPRSTTRPPRSACEPTSSPDGGGSRSTAAVSPPPRGPPAAACLATTGPTQITRPYRSHRC